MRKLLKRILAAVALILAAAPAAHAASEKSCQRVQFSQGRPGWTNSGVWTEKGDLLIADALRKQILRYSREGRALGGLPGKIEALLEDFSPRILRSTTDGRLVAEGAEGSLIVLNKKYIPLARVDIRAKSSDTTTNGAAIGALSLWEPIGNNIFAFSTMAGPKKGDYSLGIISFPLTQPQAFTSFRSMKYTESLSLFYRLGHPYLASLDGIGYVLLMENKMSILRARGGKLEDIGAFPAQLSLSPQLPSFESKDDLPWVMKAVENSTMPTGLYGWEHSLYVLWRKPEGAKTQWFLTEIDPDEERVVRTVSIKTTSANHLTVVPGPDAWAFIEKGPVRAWGTQSIKSILLVPVERVRSAFRGGGDLCQ